MKKCFLLILMAIMLSSCYNTTYMVDGTYKLKDANANYGIGIMSNNSYSDEYITIIPTVAESRINLILINNHKSSIRVLWDNAAFVDSSGTAQRVIHMGVKLVDKDKAQVPSVIPIGSRLSDVAVPADGIEWVNGNWNYMAFHNNNFDNLQDAERVVSNYKQTPSLTEITLLLPIEVDDKKIEYTLNFVGDKFQIKSVETYDAKASLNAIYGWSAGLTLLTYLLTMAIL